MKFASFLTLASLAVSAAFAQSIDIGYPLPNSTITPGTNITVQVIRPVRNSAELCHACIVAKIIRKLLGLPAELH